MDVATQPMRADYSRTPPTRFQRGNRGKRVFPDVYCPAHGWGFREVHLELPTRTVRCDGKDNGKKSSTGNPNPVDWGTIWFGGGEKNTTPRQDPDAQDGHGDSGVTRPSGPAVKVSTSTRLENETDPFRMINMGP